MNKRESKRVRIQHAKDHPMDPKSRTLLSVRTEGNSTAPTGITMASSSSLFFFFQYISCFLGQKYNSWVALTLCRDCGTKQSRKLFYTSLFSWQLSQPDQTCIPSVSFWGFPPQFLYELKIIELETYFLFNPAHQIHYSISELSTSWS